MSVMASISRFFSELFRYRKTSFTLLAVLTYALCIFLDFYAEYSSMQIPYPEPAPLSAAWSCLQQISFAPHPYTTHFNDVIFLELNSTVSNIISKNPENFDISTDLYNTTLFKQQDVFNAASTDARIIYFEPNNVIVKIKGSNPKLGAILVSAHYDSVPTSYGTTDDGMGIASMIGVLTHFADPDTKAPLRDIILNFNNDEEFGLLGATTFIGDSSEGNPGHPWAKNVKYFINLEGTGAGGRSILFRATDFAMASFYSDVPSPFASLVFQQGFNSRFVSSETDYKVYLQQGLRGVDIAFYRPRSLYHTYRDSILWTTRNSLYHMLSNCIAMTDLMANHDSIETMTDNKSMDQPIFFDIFGKIFIVFPLNVLYHVNIVLVTVLPIVTLILLSFVNYRIVTLGEFLKAGVAIGVAIILMNFVADYILQSNPMIVSLNYNIVLLVLTSITLLVIAEIMQIWTITFGSGNDDKLALLLILTFALWVINVICTAREAPPSVATGEWIFSLIYFVFGMTSVYGIFNHLLCGSSAFKRTHVVRYVPMYVQNDEFVDNEQQQQSEDDASDSDSQDDESEDLENQTENTPLLTINRKITSTSISQNENLLYDWSIEFLFIVPICVYFIYTNTHSLLQGIYENSHSGYSATEKVFRFLKLSSIGMALPLIPFSSRLNYLARVALLITAIVGVFISVTVFPLTFDNPLNASVYQDVDGLFRVRGVEGYIYDVLSDLPSMKSTNVKVDCDQDVYGTEGMETCTFQSPFLPTMYDSVSEKHISGLKSLVNITVIDNDSPGKSPYEPRSARLLLDIRANRHCTMTFGAKSSKSVMKRSPVRMVSIFHEDINANGSTQNGFVKSTGFNNGYNLDDQGTQHFKWTKGIDLVQLHKLSWEEPRVIGLQWIPLFLEDEELEENEGNAAEATLSVNLECYWSEYGNEYGSVQAYEELLQYSPRYMVYTKTYPGLVMGRAHVDL